MRAQGVIRYYGARPSFRNNQVFVANHTSMVDFIILEQTTPFAVIMQRHGGWVGYMQSTARHPSVAPARPSPRAPARARASETSA